MAKCKTVNVCGKRRKLCWGANGKIRSNTSASGSKGRRSHGSAGKCRKANGQIKKGCRMSKSGRLSRVR